MRIVIGWKHMIETKSLVLPWMFQKTAYMCAQPLMILTKRQNIEVALKSGASARTGVVLLVVASSARVSARVAGKVGGFSNKSSGKTTSGINEEIIWISIGMAIAIAILIVAALIYILYEKCLKRRASREQS